MRGPAEASGPREAPVRSALRDGGWVLLGIVALGAALRYSTITVQSFSDDELFTAWLVKMPFGDMISAVPLNERTPHLFYVLEWICSRLLGSGEAGLRVFPAAIGTITVPAVYVAGAVGASRRVGLIAAAVAAVNPFLVWYSQEARAYSLLVLMCALALMWLIVFARTGRGSALAGWSLASAAAMATHYFALFLVLPEIVWVLYASQVPRRWRAAAVGTTGVAGLALLPLALEQRTAVDYRAGLGGHTLIERLVATPKNFLVGFSIPVEPVAVVIAGLIAIFGLYLALRKAEGGQRWLALFTLTLGCASVALAFVIAPLGFDYAASRNLIPVVVAVALLLACGFAVGRTGLAAFVGLAAVSIGIVIGVAADPRYQRRNWRGAAQALGALHGSRVLLFVPHFSNQGPFRIYFGRESTVFFPRVFRPQEIAVLGLAQFKNFGPGVAKPPGGKAKPAPPGFRLVEDIRRSTYRIVRYRAARPLHVSDAWLIRLQFRGAYTTYVWQPAYRSTQR